MLEPVPYQVSKKNTWVEITYPEFTSLCPRTGLPDMGTINIKYLPDRFIIELKSLKYYFLQFRNVGIFYESLTPLILDHLTAALQPFEMTVEASFTPRGGMTARITSSYKKE
ncbi:MAG: preQ(1) synthase [Candidatus Aminicenantes bacterium]|nr:preQ(1) synthase [Candidatus Aminicenantes bacterium]